MPSYDLLSELLLEHNSHSSFLPKLLPIITPTNTSNITRIKQTKHIKDKAKAITVTEVFEEALEAAVTLETVTVFREVKTAADMIY